MSRIPPSLRSGANGYGDYTNGYYNGDSARRYDRNDDDSDIIPRSSTDRRRDRRAGGYGGFRNEDNEYQDPYEGRVNRPASLERSPAKRRSGERGYGQTGNRSRSRPSAGRYGDGERQIEEVLDSISREWDFMTDDKCIPVEVALKLLDSSSLGLADRYGDFRGTHQQLQSALKAIVNEHHQGFNSSIGTFHKIQSSLHASQQRVRTLKDGLVQAKGNLSTAKSELRGFATASQNYDDMLQVLNAIEQLQSVQEKLEARISEKRFLSAVEILQDALRIIRRSEMENISALSDLAVYLSNQEHSLTDILIEELHSHLYLKSPYCEDRWKVYAQNQPKSAGVEDSTKSIESRGRTLYYFLDKLDTSVPMTDDSSRNPEADTFQYIQLVVEALNRMSRLEVAMDTIEQRLPVELFKVVEKSNTEVVQRHPSTIRAYANKARGKLDTSLEGDDARTALLNDLLWTLYARFEAIAEGHRVVHDVVTGIVKRDGLTGSAALTRGFRELWQLYQSEIRSLLHDYLSSDGDMAYRSGQGPASSGNAFQRTQRDKTKRMFKISNMDTKSADLVAEREDLEVILKTSVPGLVSDSKTPNGLMTNDNNNMHDGSATGHKLLVEPSVFNMGILLPPSLDFLNRLKEVVPPGSDIVSSTITSFLDDFLVNVFHPQLDETLVDLCAQTFIESDAFQQDPQWALHSRKPIFKGTTKFFALITAFCRMLDNLPHDQAFSQLIITQMVTYYDKSYGWYKELVTRPQASGQTGSRMKASATWADSDEIRSLVNTVSICTEEEKPAMLEKEIKVLIAKAKDHALEESDLMSDRKSTSGLCMLYISMRWLATKINQLRHISDRATDSSRRDSGKPKHTRRWTLVQSAERRAEGAPVYLPLNRDTAVAFDGVVQSYQQLAATVLQTLHLEVRCHIIHTLYRSIHTTFTLEQPVDEPDPGIVALNAVLVGFDEDISNHLMPQQHAFITNGLSRLMDDMLVTNASEIKTMNENGCGRMAINILVLQQNLKNIEPKALLSRSAAYYDFFIAGPDAVIARAKETGGKDLGFTYDELKVLIELYYSETLQTPRRDVATQAKRSMDDHLLQLSEHLWQT